MSKQTIDVTFTVKTTWLIDGNPGDAHKEVSGLFSNYLSDKENPFFEDYGVGAWGGYDGPNILTAEVEVVPEKETP